MQEEKRPLDPTRKLLRVFGVKVTDYEERTAAILARAAEAGPQPGSELLKLTGELLELTADLNGTLREMNDHVLNAQTRALSELQAALERAR